MTSEHHLSPPVVTAVADGVATVTLNRGTQRNALHPDLIRELTQTLDLLSGRPDVRAVILTGSGPAFCAGLDLAHLATLDAAQRMAYMRSAFALFEQLYSMPQPTIAAVNGPAVAGGFDLAVFCDLRLCVPAARFAQPEVILGVTQFFFPLYLLVGVGRARELALTGDAISAEEAYRIGLVNHLVPPDQLMDRAIQLAGTIASRPRETVLESKRLSHEIPGLDREAAFSCMGQALDRSIQSETHRKALADYMDRVLKRADRE
jgi:enoyl-CoA hydratase/carnithine racemase